MGKENEILTESNNRHVEAEAVEEIEESQGVDAVTRDIEDVNGQPQETQSSPGEDSVQLDEPAAEALAVLLKEAQKKADEHWDALLRAKAEVENLRKRSARELENAHKFGLERFVAELLPVKDSLELGVAAAGEEGVSLEQVREGEALTLKMLGTALEKFGIEEIDPQGAVFDPSLHEAMTMQEAENVASGNVVTVVQKGYLLNGRLIRPAMVIVAR